MPRLCILKVHKYSLKINVMKKSFLALIGALCLFSFSVEAFPVEKQAGPDWPVVEVCQSDLAMSSVDLVLDQCNPTGDHAVSLGYEDRIAVISELLTVESHFARPWSSADLYRQSNANFRWPHSLCRLATGKRDRVFWSSSVPIIPWHLGSTSHLNRTYRC